MTSRRAVNAPRARYHWTARRVIAPLGMGLALAGGLLAGAQGRSARRRYAATHPSTWLVDLTVSPGRPHTPGAVPVELAALGDSGMAGVGVRDAAQTLPVLLARRVAEVLGCPVHVVGYGRPGARTADVRAEQVRQLRRPIDAIVVMVGTNDVVRATAWPRLARETAGLLDELTAQGTPVVLSSLPEFRAMTAVPRMLRALVLVGAAGVRVVHGRIVRDREGVTLVDVRRAVGRRFIREPSTMSADGFHPSAVGYALIADVLAPVLVEALTTRRERLAASK